MTGREVYMRGFRRWEAYCVARKGSLSPSRPIMDFIADSIDEALIGTYAKASLDHLLLRARRTAVTAADEFLDGVASP